MASSSPVPTQPTVGGSVLALDASTRPGLWVIRSLGRQGIRVVAGDTTARSPGFWSRFTSASTVYPHPTRNPQEFTQHIREAIARYNVKAIFPSSDMTLIALAAVEGALRPLCVLPIPERQYVEKVVDKAATLEVARQLAIPCPQTFHPASKAEAVQIAQSLGYPVVLKPALKTTTHPARGLDFKSAILVSQSDLEAFLARLPEGRGFPLLQAYEKGFGVGIELLMRSGEVLAVFQHRRWRDKPPEGGVSVLRESTPLDPVLVERATGLLRALHWEGAAMVEFRQGPGGPSRATFMEINGRFWGSLALAIACGVDFPYLTYQAFVEGRSPAPQPYSIGVLNHWILGDLTALVMRLQRRRRAIRHLDSESSPNPFLSFLRCCLSPSVTHDVFWGRDLKPAAREAIDLAMHGLGS